MICATATGGGGGGADDNTDSVAVPVGFDPSARGAVKLAVIVAVPPTVAPAGGAHTAVRSPAVPEDVTGRLVVSELAHARVISEMIAGSVTGLPFGSKRLAVSVAVFPATTPTRGP